jgi:2-phosphosulfolactate phosphatase
MIPLRVILLPSLLTESDIVDRTVVVFDVLRATTTIANALRAGAKAIRVFDSLDAARAAARVFDGPKLLAGEQECLPPADFDLGNSPGDFTAERCVNRTIFMSTTNGTRALVAARRARTLMTGAIVNARATADALRHIGRPITLLCSGTAGHVALEDLQGCGTVIEELGVHSVLLENDEAQVALHQSMTDAANDRLFVSRGGRNVLKANLGDDISFAATRNLIDIAVEVEDRTGTLVATRCARYA